MAAKLASSHAVIGTPTIFTHAILPGLFRALPIPSTQMNHFNHMPLLALNTSAALTERNFTATFIPLIYLISITSYPSIAIREGKLHITSKLRTSPTRTVSSAQIDISFTHSSLTGAMGFGAATPLATSAKDLAPRSRSEGSFDCSSRASRCHQLRLTRVLRAVGTWGKDVYKAYTVASLTTHIQMKRGSCEYMTDYNQRSQRSRELGFCLEVKRVKGKDLRVQEANATTRVNQALFYKKFNIMSKVVDRKFTEF
ncbi:hypothetical protein LXL04_022269 [Taraxacum kok-saghyz]